MTLNKQSTVIFVHSTAHWESIQQQKAQLLGVKPQPEQVPKKITQDKTPKANESTKKDSLRSHLIGKEGSRRRKRWTNSNFSDHPTAVLYAEDLRPPGYESSHSHNHNHRRKVVAEILATDEDMEDMTMVEDKEDALPRILTRHIRHDLKKLHISQGLVANYESQLVQFIDLWLEDLECLDHVYTKVISKNQFERYVLHTMSRYYGFHSFSVTNDRDDRETYICHPAYADFITKKDMISIDYMDAANWAMPERSFFEYLFHSRC